MYAKLKNITCNTGTSTVSLENSDWWTQVASSSKISLLSKWTGQFSIKRY